ncbi:PREDICTED: rab-like protein 2A [Amphimedon queenslandica]|uniref:Uncharacterized protein n=1 Tax=Amphimedon queenslandica TaxID=400682 RepID=A0A1X7VMA9_AMPQE|nr:PREDICTED: rab-like protein 2A [Amphimedon queenslandica]|eukprot:XP_003383383.1 PREDICTED: rab-like protein 2A [Amphimedon queenslandica]
MAAISSMDSSDPSSQSDIKIICLGDSAVGKSKLVERYLMDKFKPQRHSTYAVTLFAHKAEINDRTISVDLWDTAGQERFQSMHPSYYHGAHGCILVFDVTRKITYKNLAHWYSELRESRPKIPCILLANKIDVDMKVTKTSFKFASKHKLPFYFVSARDGTNVVKAFRDITRAALAYKETSQDLVDQILEELREMQNEGMSDEESDSHTTPDSNHDLEKVT